MDGLNQRRKGTDAGNRSRAVVSAMTWAALCGCGKTDDAATQLAPLTRPPVAAATVTAATPSEPSFPVLPAPSALPIPDTPALFSAPGEPEAGRAPAPPPVSAAESARAKALFDRLATPGLEEETWKSTQAELLRMEVAAVPGLADRLQHGNEFDRELAATLLAQLGPAAESASQTLQTALADPSPYVRVNAAAALIQLSAHDAAAAALLDLLRSADEQLRQIAAANLAAIGPQASAHVDTLAAALQPDESPEVLLPVVELLGKIGPPAQSVLPRLKQLESLQPEVAHAAREAVQLISGETPAR